MNPKAEMGYALKFVTNNELNLKETLDAWLEVDCHLPDNLATMRNEILGYLCSLIDLEHHYKEGPNQRTLEEQKSLYWSQYNKVLKKLGQELGLE